MGLPGNTNLLLIEVSSFSLNKVQSELSQKPKMCPPFSEIFLADNAEPKTLKTLSHHLKAVWSWETWMGSNRKSCIDFLEGGRCSANPNRIL